MPHGAECSKSHCWSYFSVNRAHGRAVTIGIRRFLDSRSLANEEGGINGKKIEYLIKDGQYNLEVAKKAFDKIMNQYKPMIMFGQSTALGFAVAPDTNELHKILYSSTSFSGKLAYTSWNQYVFVSGATYADQVAILLKYIAKVKPKAKVAFLFANTEMVTEQ
jgi:branched-chain amino acid transport system substrate-binding protein